MQNFWLIRKKFPIGQRVIVNWPDNSNLHNRQGKVNLLSIENNVIVVEVAIWHQVYGFVYYSVLPKNLLLMV